MKQQKGVFGAEVPIEEVIKNTRGTSGIFIPYANALPVGFASYGLRTVNNQLIGVLHGVVIDKKFQGNGLYKKLTSKRVEKIRENSASLVVTQTQNPRVYKTLLDIVDVLHPSINGTVSKQALDISKAMKSSVDEDLILKKYYGRMLTGKRIYSKDPQVNELFELLNAKRGDAFALVGELE